MPTRAEALADEAFTLCLSAGFFGFFAHTGVLAELEARALRPQRVVGVSAGSLAGGLWSMGLSAEALGDRLARLERDEFWDPGFPLGLPVGGLLRGQKFARILDELLEPLGRHRLERARVPMTVVVWELRGRKILRLDRGPVSPAIRASCAVPGLFRPVRVAGRLCWDGGVADRIGASALRPKERALTVELPHHSPWPEFGRAPQPDDAAMRFVPQGLPRVHPFALERGADAKARARAQFAAWLDGDAPAA